MQMLLQMHAHACCSCGALFTPGPGCKPCSDWISTDLWTVPPWHGSNGLGFCGSRCHLLPTFIGMKVEVFLDSLDNLNEVSRVSSFLKLGKLGMLCELWWALLLSLRTCRSKKCAPQRSCEWWMNFEWIISQIILGCTQSSLVVNQASIYITGRLLMSEWVQEPCKTSKPLQIYHISVEGLVSDGLSSKDLERFWKIGTNSWCTAQTWLTTTSRPSDFREGWTSNTSIWSLVSLKMLLRCRRPEDFPKLGHCPGKWSEGAFMIFMILGPGII
jgi:hypothetical protein